MIVNEGILKAHLQCSVLSCIPMAVELVLKLLGKVDLNYFEQQKAWTNPPGATFALYDGKEIEGVKFERQFSEPRDNHFPLDKLFATIDAELAANRYVIISLTVPGNNWHNYVIHNRLPSGEYEAATKGRAPERINDVRAQVHAMNGTDILTYQET